MKLLPIVKSVAVAEKKAYGQPEQGKTKYFEDQICASFHIQSRASKFQFNIEPLFALFDGSKYYEAIKTTEFPRVDVQKLMTGVAHNVYVVTQSDGDGGYDSYITTEKPSEYYRSAEPKILFIDENRTMYWMGKEFPMQPVPKELADIRATITTAIASASHRQNAEYRQAAALFTQRKQEFERAQQELVRTKADLDMEAATLASDAMDFSQ